MLRFYVGLSSLGVQGVRLLYEDLEFKECTLRVHAQNSGPRVIVVRMCLFVTNPKPQTLTLSLISEGLGFRVSAQKSEPKMVKPHEYMRHPNIVGTALGSTPML